MQIELVVPKTVRSLTLPYREVRVAVLGDIHYSGPDGPTDLTRLRQHIAWCVDQDCYFLGTGDNIEFASPSNRRRLSEAALYDSAEEVVDQAVSSLEQGLFHVLEPTRGRWLGLVQGHHYYTHLDGTTTDTRMAQYLGCPFLGDAAYVVLRFAHKQGHSQHASIYVTHGVGSAQTWGGILAKVTRLALSIYAQVYVVGHYHVRGAWPEQRLIPRVAGRQKPTLDYEPYWFVLGGSFMRGYMQDHQFAGRPQGTYVEKAMLRPTQLGAPIIYIRPKMSDGVAKLDLNVSP